MYLRILTLVLAVNAALITEGILTGQPLNSSLSSWVTSPRNMASGIAFIAILVAVHGATAANVWHNPNRIAVNVLPSDAALPQQSLRKAQQNCQRSAILEFVVRSQVHLPSETSSEPSWAGNGVGR